jgi:DNA-binding response OmpR family regulator
MAGAVVLAEVEEPARGLLERHLVDDGFEVHGVAGGREALELAERAKPDLVLLSSLADEPAVEVCRRLREGEPGRSWNRSVPVIVIGELQSDTTDRVRALDRGADDFLSAPFQYEELLARIHAVLRRTSPRTGDRLVAGDVVVDLRTRRVTVGGASVGLAGKEFALLSKLAGDPTRVWTKEELLRDVWGFRSSARTRTVDSHASRLRRKLNGAEARLYVLNVWGVGYRLMDD